MSKEVLAAIIGAVAALVAGCIPLLNELRKRSGQEYKLVYVRIPRRQLLLCGGDN